MKHSKYFGLLGSMLPLLSWAAGNQVATLSQVTGKVQIFSHPSSKAPTGKRPDETSLAFYEGKYYLIKDAAVGDRVENDNVVRSMPGGQATVIYDNGDQIYLGNSSAYRIHWKSGKTKAEAPPELDLVYGRLRGVISKEGPRQKLKVKTRVAVMGVRGTDFFVVDDDPKGEVGLTVVRGAVEVETKSGKKVEVKTDMTADLSEKAEVRKTSRDDLAEIQESIAPPAVQEKPEMITELEKKALEVTLKDIEIYQPETFQALQKDGKKQESLLVINTTVIANAKEIAPVATRKRIHSGAPGVIDPEAKELYEKFFRK